MRAGSLSRIATAKEKFDMKMTKKQLGALVEELATSGLSDREMFARIMSALSGHSRRWGVTYQAVIDRRKA
jgi:hypothetical protein